jgi:hypothetical protein
MKADYLTLADGRRVRVMFNMNALGKLSKEAGIEMTDLAEGKADINTLRTIAWCSAMEGEALDGREFNLSEVEFGRLITMQGIVAFSAILTEQSSSEAQKKSPQEGRFPRMFFRKKG